MPVALDTLHASKVIHENVFNVMYGVFDLRFCTTFVQLSTVIDCPMHLGNKVTKQFNNVCGTLASFLSTSLVTVLRIMCIVPL